MSTMRVGGLASGMDIDSLVEKLMQAERAPLDKLEQQKQTYEWQREAYRNVNTKLQTFDTYIADNLIIKSINTKTATSSNADLVSATATSTATGSVSIEGVSQLATAARSIGEKINATNSTKLKELGITDTSIEIRAIQKDGELASKATKIEFSEETTVEELISKINSSGAGVNAFFENGRLSITASNSGNDKNGAEIVVDSGNQVFAAFKMKDTTNLASNGTNAIFHVNGISTERTTNTFTISGYNVTLKETFNIESMNFDDAFTQYKLSKSNLYHKVTEYNNKDNEYSNALSTYNQIYNDTFSLSPGLESQYNQLDGSFLTSLSDEEIIEIKTYNLSGDDPLATLSDSNPLKSKLSMLTSEQINVVNTLTSDQLRSFKNVAVNKDLLDKAEVEKNTALLKKNNAENEYNSSYVTFKELYINKGFLPSNSTEDQIKQSIEDLSDAPKLSNKVVNLTATSNVDEIIAKLKDFVTTYNGLVTDLTNLTSETKYRDYKPLTTPQREEMEDKEIELWETKSKSGILRGDSIISNGLSSMRSLIYESNPAVTNTKFNTLYNIGISTSSNYLSGGTLEIDEDKLRKALEEDPDAVTKMLNNISGKEKDTVIEDGVTKTIDTRGFLQKLRGEMSKIKVNIEGRAGRSTMTETQYTLGKYLKDVDDSIDTWKDKLESIETRYWNQFTAMETMINKANSQSTSLSSYFS